MNTVLVAGATGYLGTHLVAAFRAKGFRVHALVRNRRRAELAGLKPEDIIVADPTDPATLRGSMESVEVVASALGITRQRDGLSYRDVDYQANLNLLNEAVAAKVRRFCYVHVLNAEAMPHVPLVAAKRAFADKLRAAPIQSTIVRPSGFFSDMEDFLSMARSGRIWLFGDGERRLNPIHGADLAEATVEAIAAGRDTLDVGGPDVLSQKEVAQLAFRALEEPAAITCLPDWVRRGSLKVLPWLAPRHVSGPARFFLTAMGMDMIGERVGTRHLEDHFRSAARSDGRLGT